jgi:hypothetical protein
MSHDNLGRRLAACADAAHEVMNLFFAAKAVCHDQARCLEFPRLAKALERFEDATVGAGGRGDD